MSRYARRKAGDNNRQPIVRVWEEMGCSVLDLNGQGDGCADYLVGWCGGLGFVEVKNPATAYGQAGLTEEQQKFRARWASVPFFVVRTQREAEEAARRIARRAMAGGRS